MMAAARRKAGMAGAAAAASLAAAMLLAGAAAAQETFRIGLVALPGEEAGVEGLAEIKAAYAAALGLPVEVMVARDYAALAEAHIAGRVDYAVYSAPAFAAAFRRCGCLRPVAAPVDADGAVGLRSVLVVRSRGAGEDGRLAVGPADSLATRLAPLAASQAARRAASAGRLVEAASAAEAEALFLDGKVDGFFGWEPVGQSAPGEARPGGSPARLAAAGLDAASYGIAWRSEVLRYGPHAVHVDMPAERVERLARLLERTGGDRRLMRPALRGHGGGFAAVSQDDYRAVAEALDALGEP